MPTGALRSLTKLDVSLNALKSLPTEVAGLASLRILFSLGNQFEDVPPVLRGLPSLYMLSFKSNKLARIAEEALAPTVEWLILTDNLLTSLPRSIGQCTNLRKCMLTNNRLNYPYPNPTPTLNPTPTPYPSPSPQPGACSPTTVWRPSLTRW